MGIPWPSKTMSFRWKTAILEHCKSESRIPYKLIGFGIPDASHGTNVIGFYWEALQLLYLDVILWRATTFGPLIGTHNWEQHMMYRNKMELVLGIILALRCVKI